MNHPIDRDNGMRRREVLKGAALAATLGTFASAGEPSEQPLAATQFAGQAAIVDTNIHLFHWPFRRLPDDSTDRLVERLRAHGVAQAWAGSFEAILHRDVHGVNARLAEACAAVPDRLIPLGTVNLGLPDWEEDLRRCHEVHRMPGIRLYPNYHGYTLEDPRFAQLLTLASRRGMLVQLAASMEDPRTQHPMLQVADVDLSPLTDQIQKVPQAKLMILNHKLRGDSLARLIRLPGVHFDTARVESTGGISQLARITSPQRVLFGSHAPFFIHQSALIKLDESRLTDNEALAICVENAQRLLTPSRA